MGERIEEEDGGMFLHDGAFAATACIGGVFVVELISSSILTISSCW